MVDRREFLKMMALCGVYGAFNRATGNLLAATPPLTGREPAKSVIEIWVWGGPSHIETFDPKPGAGKAYNGGYGDIPTNVKGIRISEFLPKLAQQADKYSIIRSMCHRTNGHETATYLMQTGRMPGDGITYPAIGAVIAMLKSGTYKGKLPPYIALTTNKGRFSENGFLSDRFKPLATGSNPNFPQFLVDGFVTPGASDGEPLPHQLSNRTRAHPYAINLCQLYDAVLLGHAVLAFVSKRYPPHKGRLLTRYSPVRH